MVAAVVGVGEVFRDFGLSSAAIQAPTISQSERSNLFWINGAIGAFLAALCVALAPLVEQLYGDPQVRAIMQVSAITFVLNGFATQFRADLTRALRFKALALLDAIAQAAGLAVGIGLAAMGYGYWALVAMSISQAAVGLAGAIVASRWAPTFYDRGTSIRSFFRFGAGVAGAQLLGYASKNVDSIALGVTLGPVAVGYYNRAYQVLMLPLNQMQAPSTRVALPVLSKLHDDRPRYDAFLLQGQSVLLNAVGIVLAYSAALADPLFAVLLGDQWAPAVPLFQALAIGGLASMANYACYWVFLSKGLTGSHFRFSLVTRPVMVVAIVLAATMAGPLLVAATYSLVSVVFWPFTLLWLRRVSDAPVGEMFWNGLRAFIVYGVVGCATWLLMLHSQMGALLTTILGAGAFLLLTAVAALIWPRYRRDVIGILRLRLFFRRSR
jgi:PST family polysaccharide transporter